MISLRPFRGSISEAGVQFFLGIFLFAVVVGLVDARVPWPKASKRGVRA